MIRKRHLERGKAIVVPVRRAKEETAHLRHLIWSLVCTGLRISEALGYAGMRLI
jgi:hypothetical protein